MTFLLLVPQKDDGITVDNYRHVFKMQTNAFSQLQHEIVLGKFYRNMSVTHFKLPSQIFRMSTS